MCAFIRSAATAQALDEVLQACFTKVSNGDMRNFDTIRTVIIESTGRYDGHAYNQSRPDFTATKGQRIRLLRVWPDKTKFELYEDTVLLSQTVANGDEHYFIFGKSEPMKTDPGPYEKGFELDPVLISNLLKKGKATLTGVKRFDTGDCFDVLIKTKSLSWHFYFNTTTHLLDYWSNSPDEDEGSLTALSGYKTFGNVLIPTVEIKSKNGVPFFWAEIKSIVFNQPIPNEVSRVR